jgi:hypothetical protein
VGSETALTGLIVNLRSGRWRSEYIVDLDKGEISGKILVNVHYYEQGNVRQPVY